MSKLIHYQVDRSVVGFVIASLYYKEEYGVSEPNAWLDAIGVNPADRGQHMGKAWCGNCG